ncbi:hypothetical protein GCM10023096_67640 [Nonomuraea ferruginea]
MRASSGEVVIAAAWSPLPGAGPAWAAGSGVVVGDVVVGRGTAPGAGSVAEGEVEGVVRGRGTARAGAPRPSGTARRTTSGAGPSLRAGAAPAATGALPPAAGVSHRAGPA